MPLNPEQRLAVETTEGAVRVAAGAGTGKTQTLTERYIHIVRDLGVRPGNILCATFTNRAANEMKARVRSRLGDQDTALICTFHAFCVQLLKEEIHRLNWPRRFIILDVEDQRAIVARIFAELKISLRDFTVQRAIDEILEARKFTAMDYIADFCEAGSEALRRRAEEATARADKIFLRYLYEQKMCYGLDFNDLINFALHFLQNFPEVAEKWQHRMEYVMVDEFQDVSLRQYTIARILSAFHGNLFIVGDPDQTIYTWRGSHQKLFLDFPKDYPESSTVILKENYRSTPQILQAGNTLIAKNAIRFPKELHTVRPDGPKPVYRHASSARDEAKWIASQILKLTSAEFEDKPYRRSQIAVLYRAHYLSRAIEVELINAHIPYRLYSSTEFYQRTEVKDVLCYMRMVTTGDNPAFRRVIDKPARRIGKKKLEYLENRARELCCSLFDALRSDYTGPQWRGCRAADFVEPILRIRALRELRTPPPLEEQLQRLLDLSGYEHSLEQEGNQLRLDNLAELKRAVAQFSHEDPDATMEDFLQAVALLADIDREADKRDSVKLMTVHTAKGLEFPCIFVAGLNEGVFPSRKCDTPEAMDEERRLAYVAFTRARERLHLSDAEGIDNDNLIKYPSRFIFDAGQNNIDYVLPLPSELLERTREYIDADNRRLQSLSSLFTPQSRITHKVFGPGTILGVNLRDHCYEIQFDRLKSPRMLRFDAPLFPAEETKTAPVPVQNSGTGTPPPNPPL